MAYLLDSLPFLNLSDEQFALTICGIQSNLLLSSDSINNNSLNHIDKMKFDQFNFNIDYSAEITDANIDNDPNLNFFKNDLNITDSTKYVFEDDLNLNSNMDKNILSICSFNVNSLSKNLEEFKYTFMHDHKFSIVGFVETKITQDIENLFSIDGYEMYHNSHMRNSGGVSMYISNDFLGHFERKDLRKSNKHIECIFVEIPIVNQSKNIIVGNIYHRPNSSGIDFIKEFTDILNEIVKENKKIYLIGDFNLDLLKYNESLIVRNFVDLLHGCGLLSLINKPTRVTNSTATLIDHVWSNDYQNLNNSCILYSFITDHFPTYATFEINDNRNLDNNGYIELKYKKHSEQYINIFKSNLKEVNWDLVISSNDPNASFNNFPLIFNAVYNKNFPIETKNSKRNIFLGNL